MDTEQLRGLDRLSERTRSYVSGIQAPMSRQTTAEFAALELSQALGVAYELARTNTPGSVLCTCDPLRVDYDSHSRTCPVADAAGRSYLAGIKQGRIEADHIARRRQDQGARTVADRIRGYRVAIRNLQGALLQRENKVLYLRDVIRRGAPSPERVAAYKAENVTLQRGYERVSTELREEKTRRDHRLPMAIGLAAGLGTLIGWLLAVYVYGR